MLRQLIAAATLAIASVSAAADPATPRWSPTDLRELVEAIEEAPADGLDPADYDLPELNAAIASGDALRIDASASAHFRHLAGDRWEGHVRGNEGSTGTLSGPWPIPQRSMNSRVRRSGTTGSGRHSMPCCRPAPNIIG